MYYYLEDKQIAFSLELPMHARRIWTARPTRDCLWYVVTEALVDGADITGIRLFAAKHAMDGDDLIKFMSRYQATHLQFEGVKIFLEHILDIKKPLDFLEWFSGSKGDVKFADYSG